METLTAQNELPWIVYDKNKDQKVALNKRNNRLMNSSRHAFTTVLFLASQCDLQNFRAINLQNKYKVFEL